MSFLWPMVTAACITMGLIHIRVGLRLKAGAAHLIFAFTALLFAAFSVLELNMMLARSSAQFLALLRWSDILGAAGAMSLAAFVYVSFSSGRKWLALLGSSLLCGALALNAYPVPKLVFLHMTGIRTVETFGGASYAVAEGTRNPWVAVYYLGVLIIAAFVADAAATLWHRGGRRRAALVGGTTTLFILSAGVQTALVDAAIIATPYFVSFFYLAILTAMAVDLSDEVVNASRLAEDLKDSQERLKLAADAAQLGLWVWDIERDDIWITTQGRKLFGFTGTDRLDINRFFAAVHPDDREVMKQAVSDLLLTDAEFMGEYRVVVPNRGTRWVAVRGQVERNDAGRALRIRGAILDVSRRKAAEQAAQNLSGRLINAQEAERARLARELHDDFNQSLALLAVELDLVGRNPPAASAEITSRMHDFSAQIKKLSSAVHRLSHGLHPAKLEQLGLVAAVRGFCREIAAARDIDIEFETHEVPRSLPEDVALCLYRVVQEGLQNVARHSGAKDAKVQLTANEREICLVVSDKGCGFDAAKTMSGGSLGLVSMRERVRLVHGDITVRSRSGEGTRIEVRVPLGRVADDEVPPA
jgi:PAS domain S-box-containing protein